MFNQYGKGFTAALLGMAMLGLLLVSQPTAAQSLQQKAKAGDATSQARLAVEYYTGEGSVPKDLGMAFAWAKNAADQGDVGAQAMVGVMYSQGQGIKQDKEEAAYWYEKAAEQGDINSQFLIGMFRATGTGVDQDFGKAANWFAQAAAEGHAGSLAELGYLFMTGQGVKESKPIAFALLTLSKANDPSPGNKAHANWTKISQRMSSEEFAAGKKLAYALIEPGNFTEALKNAYSKL